MLISTKDYSEVSGQAIGGVEYQDGTIEATYHAEGRGYFFTNDAQVFTHRHEYAIKDHLGNIRLWVSDLDGDGILETPNEILQEKHFYPFGMAMEGPWMESSANPVNKYQYNGKELHTEFGLNLMDYGARWYDAAVGRWWSVDLMAEKYSPISPYAYVANSPIVLIDPDGMNIKVSGDTDALKDLIKYIFNNQIEGRIKEGNLTLHKKGASDDDSGLDGERDAEFISGLDQGVQIVFGVVDEAIQSDKDINIESHKSSDEIVGGQWGEHTQKLDISDLIMLDKKSKGAISAAGGFAHEVKEAYEQQVNRNTYSPHPKYMGFGKIGQPNNGHRLALDVEGKINGYDLRAASFLRTPGTQTLDGVGTYRIKNKNGSYRDITFQVKKGQIKSFNK